MFSKLLFTLLAISMLNMALAADDATKVDATKTDATKKEEEKKPEPPKTWKDKLILAFHGEYGFLRLADADTNDTGKLDNFSAFYNPTIGWKFSDNWSLSSSYELKYTDHKPAGTFPNRFYRALLSLSRTNILTEKEYGFQLDGGIARRYFDRTANPTTFGNDRINVTFTKNWDKNNASLFVQYLANDPKTVTSKETWRRGLELIPSLNLQLTDKLSYTLTDDINIMTPWYGGLLRDYTVSHEFNFAVFTYKFNDIQSTYLQLKYDRGDSFTTMDTSDDLRYFVGYAYSVTPKVTFTFEMGSTVFASATGTTKLSTATANTWNKPEFTFYVDAAF